MFLETHVCLTSPGEAYQYFWMDGVAVYHTFTITGIMNALRKRFLVLIIHINEGITSALAFVFINLVSEQPTSYNLKRLIYFQWLPDSFNTSQNVSQRSLIFPYPCPRPQFGFFGNVTTRTTFFERRTDSVSAWIKV